MNYNAYRLIEPVDDPLVYPDFEYAAEHRSDSCARMLSAIEAFVGNAFTGGYRLEPGERGERDEPDFAERREIYLVPFSIGEVAAILRVDHVSRSVEFITVIPVFGGVLAQKQWADIRRIAAQALT
jgi:hypothetical protein